MYTRCNLRFLPVIAFLIYFFPAISQAALLGSRTASMLSVMQVVSENGSSQVKGAILKPMNAGAVMSPKIGAQSLRNPQFNLIPAKTFPTPFATDAAAAEAVNSYASAYLPQTVSSIANALSTKGLSGGFYSYVQTVRVMHNGTAEPRNVMGSVWVRPDGGYEFIGFKISGGNPVMLYATYVQSKPIAGLPAGWAQSNAGYIQYQLFEQVLSGSGFNLQPVSALQMENASGAYDEPQAVDVTVDPDAGLKLLISNWMKPKMQQTNAVMAIVDYARAVEPVYDLAQDGTQTARVAVSVDSRVLQIDGGSCESSTPATSHYMNAGRIGYLLNYSLDRYFVTADGSYQFQAKTSSNGISPTQNYTKSIDIPGTAQSADYSGSIIDPWSTTSLYSPSADTVNGLPGSAYAYVSGMQVQDTSAVTNYGGGFANYSNDSNDWNYAFTCRGGQYVVVVDGVNGAAGQHYEVTIPKGQYPWVGNFAFGGLGTPKTLYHPTKGIFNNALSLNVIQDMGNNSASSGSWFVVINDVLYGLYEDNGPYRTGYAYGYPYDSYNVGICDGDLFGHRPALMNLPGFFSVGYYDTIPDGFGFTCSFSYN